MTTEKSPEAFRTISEAAEDLDLPQHVLRFWETRFSQIKPLKRGGGRRYYRPDDIDLLRGIRYLLYGEGYTIKGVQRILKERGVRYVMAVWRDDADEYLADAELPQETAEAISNSVARALAAADVGGGSADDAAEAAPSESSSATDLMDGLGERPRDVLSDDEAGPGGGKSPFGFIGRLREDNRKDGGRQEANLSKEDIRRLQGTLFELLECKRLLDQAR